MERARDFRRGSRMCGSRGVTLIDTIVGIALMLVVFLGIYGAFELSVDVVMNNKARAGAIALADQRMEYIRSLTYSAVGTALGIPSGLIPQSETVALNGVTYTRRTVIAYEDDLNDSSNGTTENYKAVKVDVAWTSRSGTRHIALVTRVSPANGLATSCASCGTLVVNVVNAVSQPVAGASVSITNPSASPPISINTFTNMNGTVTLLPAPAVSGYSISATNLGYTSDQSGPFAITANSTYSPTLRIDAFSSITAVTLAYGTNAPVTSVPFTLSGSAYGYNAALGGTGSATTTASNLKWDTYTMSVSSATGYDLAYSCQPQPIALSPNTATTTILYLAPHTTNSLAVKVVASANGALVPGASVILYKTGYSATQSTDSCGQTFFGGLSSGTYNITVTATGHSVYNASNIGVSGGTQYAAPIH
jgi:hypothetical protein